MAAGPLPGIEEKLKPKLTDPQYWFFVSLQYSLIFLFTVILSIVVLNSWQILLGQKRWRTVPLTLFYVLAFLMALGRLLDAIFLFTDKPWIIFVSISSPTTKLAIGLVQTWMVIELSLRLQTAIALARDPTSRAKVSIKALFVAQTTAMSLITATYIGLIAYLVYLCQSPAKDWYREFSEGLGTGFLVVSILLAVITLCLIWQLQTLGRLMSHTTSFFRKETNSVIATFVVFDLGYVVRFIWDTWQFWTQKDSFAFWVVDDLVFITDGCTMLLLLLLHRRSFLTQGNNERQLDLTPVHWSDSIEDTTSVLVSLVPTERGSTVVHSVNDGDENQERQYLASQSEQDATRQTDGPPKRKKSHYGSFIESCYDRDPCSIDDMLTSTNLNTTLKRRSSKL